MSDQTSNRLAAGGSYRKGRTGGGYRLGKGVLERLAELMAVRRLP